MLLQRISWSITSISKIRIVALFLGIFIGTIIFVLPGQSSQSQGESPDLSLIYTAEDLYRIAESYGEDGRSAYIQARITFDVIWPLIYTAFLATSISWLYVKHSWGNSRLQYGNLLPVIGLLFDYLENVGAIIIMSRYPLRTPVIDVATTVFTPLKWISLGLSFVLLMVLMGYILWGKVREKWRPI